MQANGYRYIQYRYKNLTTTDTIGRGNLYDPVVYSHSGAKRGSNLYKLSTTDMFNVSALDDITINDQFSLMLSLSNSWIKERARNAIGSRVGRLKDSLLMLSLYKLNTTRADLAGLEVLFIIL